MQTGSRILFFFMVFLFVGATLAAAVLLLNLIGQTVLTTPIPFDIDEANHALDGWEVYHALVSGDLRGLIQAVTGQAFYPPLFSLIIAAYYLVFGPGLFASRMPTVVNFAGLILGLFGITFYLVRRSFQARKEENSPAVILALLGAGFTTALLITSPTIIRNSAISMLEITGALWVLPLMYLSAQLETLDRKHRWTPVLLAGLVVMLSFVTKYTFGLFFGLGLMAAIPSQTWPWKVSRRKWVETGVVAGIFSLFVVIWITITRRESMFLFFTDHPSYVPFLTVENLLFYPREWLTSYSISPFIGVLAFTLAGGEVIAGWKQLYVRVAAWSVLVALGILTISTTNEPRHILVVAPLVWILTGLRLAHIFQSLILQPRAAVNASLSVGLLLILFVDLSWDAVSQIQPEIIRSFEGETYYSAMQAEIIQNIDLTEPVLFIGDLDDQNNLLAYRWLAALELGRSTRELDIDHYPYRLYDRMMLRHNRRPQAHELVENFPHAPLTEVLDTGYYQTAVVSLNRKQANHFLEEVSLEPLAEIPPQTLRYPDFIIEIYDLR